MLRMRKDEKLISDIPVSFLPSLFIIEACALTRGPGQLKSSSLVPILQYGSWPYSEFLTEVLGVDTALFLYHSFSFHVPHLQFISLINKCVYIHCPWKLSCRVFVPGAGCEASSASLFPFSISPSFLSFFCFVFIAYYHSCYGFIGLDRMLSISATRLS